MNAHAATRRAVLTVLPAMAYIDPRGFAVLADPVYAAMERHRQAYDVLMDAWAQTRGGLMLDAEADKRWWYRIETAEEDSFHAVLATKPTTRAGAIACVRHVADIGLVTEEVSSWLVMLLVSPLVLAGAAGNLAEPPALPIAG